ncbi:MAG: arsenate reductase ArsC [Rhodospirillaceae bacterium]|jgi:arsenate reductase (thioredoxin)|nr:arsenate reductase ArsC [Rhodospirillaceae bacterium]MBT6119464.1 arsenate reductase ArsC [Rhodospirillaceae bacterium]
MSDEESVFNVLFLCTGNSARSILAECILNRIGRPNFKAFSAGSHPKGEVHPFALDLLGKLNYPIDTLRSKSWEEFAQDGAPPMDFVFTVCDQAAGETCPIWLGHPMVAHWGVDDPAAFVGPERDHRAFFATVYAMLERRLNIFVNLPLDVIDKLSLQQRLDEIGSSRDTAA